MPRHDCFEIDYSLGGPALFSNGGSLGWHKDEKNLVLEQIVAKSNFLLQLPGDGFSLSFSFFFSSWMIFQPSLEERIKSGVRGPSQILLIAVHVPSCPSLTCVWKCALGLHHSEYCFGFFSSCWLHFVRISPLSLYSVYPETSAAL